MKNIFSRIPAFLMGFAGLVLSVGLIVNFIYEFRNLSALESRGVRASAMIEGGTTTKKGGGVNHSIKVSYKDSLGLNIKTTMPASSEFYDLHTMSGYAYFPHSFDIIYNPNNPGFCRGVGDVKKSYEGLIVGIVLFPGAVFIFFLSLTRMKSTNRSC